MTKPLVLLVENNIGLLEKLNDFFEEIGFRVFTATNKNEAFELLKTISHELDLMIVDLHLEASTDDGWDVITYSTKKVSIPSWCVRAISTGHGETTKAAAAPSSVYFFEKGKDEKEYDEFIDITTKKAKERREGSGSDYPSITNNHMLDYNQIITCKAVIDAEEIKFKKILSGSFQDNNPLLVEIIPMEVGPSYFAVIKCCDLIKAKKEISGKNIILKYFSKIGKSVPPYNEYESLITNKQKILLSPRVCGDTLTTETQKNWMDDSVNRVDLFIEIFSEAKNFLLNIKDSRKNFFNSADLFYSKYLDTNDDAVRRYDKTVPLLENYIDADSQLIESHNFEIDIINPLYLLETRNEGNLRIKKDKIESEKFTYIHGDFHTGNIMVSIKPEKSKVGFDKYKLRDLFVLDYDYIGTGCKFFDLAQLETSFILDVSLCDAFVSQELEWKTYFSPALRVLCNSGEISSIHNNRFAWDLFRVIDFLRGTINQNEIPIFKTCLFIEMLRIFTSKCRSFYAKNENPPSSLIKTGFSYLGLLLKDLVVVTNSDKMKKCDLKI